jgi:penicillin-binding protein 1A
MFEIVRAYSSFSNAGIQPTPYSIDKVETSSGEILYQAKPEYKRVMDPYVAAALTAMLQRVVDAGTGKAAHIEGRQIAGKTGTTDDYRDAWFIGYTPEIVAGVWVGNDKNKAHHKITGGSVPALIWKDYMSAALQNIPFSGFNYPEIVLNKTAEPSAIELQPSEEVVGGGGTPVEILSTPNPEKAQLVDDDGDVVPSIPVNSTSSRPKEDLMLKPEERAKSQPKQLSTVNSTPVAPAKPSAMMRPVSTQSSTKPSSSLRME